MDAGEMVTYHDGSRAVDAMVESVNDDGSLNLLYPHFADEAVMATAGHVESGIGLYQWEPKTEPDEHPKRGRKA